MLVRRHLPHNFSAHIGECTHLNWDYIINVILDWHKTSVWQSHVGERVRSIASWPTAKSKWSICRREPFWQGVISRLMQVWLIPLGGVEDHLQQVHVRKLRNTCAFSDVLGQIKYRISIVVLRDLHEVLGASIRKEVN
jgi:hypothetical protein